MKGDGKVAGVYVIENKKDKRAYIGKSKCLRETMRVMKSKLKTGKFSNKELQEDHDFLGGCFKFIELLLEGDYDLTYFHKDIIDDYRERGWYVYNGVVYLDRVDKIEKSELSELTSHQRRFVELVIELIDKIDIDTMTSNLNNLNNL